MNHELVYQTAFGIVRCCFVFCYKEGVVVVGVLVGVAVLGSSVGFGEEEGTSVGCWDGCDEG